jgi:hypothetical protein
VVGIVIAAVSIEWMAMTPVLNRFQEEFNDTITVNTTEAQQAIENRSTMLFNLHDAVPYVVILVAILWGFMWMQQRERVTGVYH